MAHWRGHQQVHRLKIKYFTSLAGKDCQTSVFSKQNDDWDTSDWRPVSLISFPQHMPQNTLKCFCNEAGRKTKQALHGWIPSSRMDLDVFGTFLQQRWRCFLDWGEWMSQMVPSFCSQRVPFNRKAWSELFYTFWMIWQDECFPKKVFQSSG